MRGEAGGEGMKAHAMQIAAESELRLLPIISRVWLTLQEANAALSPVAKFERKL